MEEVQGLSTTRKSLWLAKMLLRVLWMDLWCGNFLLLPFLSRLRYDNSSANEYIPYVHTPKVGYVFIGSADTLSLSYDLCTIAVNPSYFGVSVVADVKPLFEGWLGLPAPADHNSPSIQFRPAISVPCSQRVVYSDHFSLMRSQL